MTHMHVRAGVVVARERIGPRLWQLTVLSAGHLRPALLYERLLPAARVGETVIVNTTALDLRLGTGGYDFVLHVLGHVDSDGGVGEESSRSGHIMKLRYTPLQLRVLAVEEEDSPHHETMVHAEHIQGVPVVILALHSQLPATAAALRLELGQAARIVYVMTDGAALPLDFSEIVRQLRAARLLDGTVTTGDAFGGDLEAVTLFSGLLAARHVLGAAAIIVAPGPGLIGTGTPFGTTAIAAGQQADAVAVLGGDALVAPRISFVDPRERHRGISHHTLTALGRVAQQRCTVVIPSLSDEQQALVQRQLKDSGISERHQVVFDCRGDDALQSVAEAGIALRSMGRDVTAERALFLTAAAAGHVAADEVKQ